MRTGAQSDVKSWSARAVGSNCHSARRVCFSTCSHLQCSFSGLQAPYKEFATHLTTPRGKGKEHVCSIPLLDLPDGILEAISMHLPPASMCLLQLTCRHLNNLLQHDRCAGCFCSNNMCLQCSYLGCPLTHMQSAIGETSVHSACCARRPYIATVCNVQLAEV